MNDVLRRYILKLPYSLRSVTYRYVVMGQSYEQIAEYERIKVDMAKELVDIGLRVASDSMACEEAISFDYMKFVEDME